MSTTYKDYYKILGVDRKATTEEINKAYKKLARTYHPDLNPDKKGAEEKFKEVNEANDVLKDPEKRKLYDQLGADYVHGQQFQRPQGFGGFGSSGGFGASGYSDFFETLFGGGFSSGAGGGFGAFSGFQNMPRKGSNIEADLALTLEEAYTGGKKTISLNAGGEARSLEVNIPAGITHGARIRLAGQGSKGHEAPSGDLLLRIKIKPHAQFTLEDNNLVYDLRLAPWDAALGCKTIIPTVDGQVELNIASGTTSDKRLRLKGKGLGTGNKKGDMLIRVSIDVAAPSSPEIQAAWEKLKELAAR